jgi:hypothetical protein
MAMIRVLPATFRLVHYDNAEIGSIARRVADAIGFGDDVEIVVQVIEESPLGRVSVSSLEPITITCEGGALEDQKAPRRLSEDNTLSSLSKVLYRVHDRQFGGFGEAPPDDRLTLAESVAWDVHAVGRSARAGFPVQRQRRLYAFRNRHGFSDVADAAFEELWNAPALTWADVQSICERTKASAA